MKNIYRYDSLLYSVLLVVVLTIMIGCAGQKSGQTESHPSDAVAVAESDFDPLGDTRDRTVIEGSSQKNQETSGKNVDNVEDFDWARVDSFLKAQNLVDSSLTIYRVQLYASQYYTEANYELQIAREIFEDTVLIKYDLPYYKVLLGNTTNRREGRRLLHNARSLGYSNSWLIETAPDSIYYRILFVKDSIAVTDSLRELTPVEEIQE